MVRGPFFTCADITLRLILFSFSTVDNLLTSYFASATSKLEYDLLSWKTIRITDSNKVVDVHRKFAAVCRNRLFQDMEYKNVNLLEKLIC
jgi:hypothetical protein